MKIALCCIGRLENKYIKDFIEYYKNLGIDKIFIYDNNYEGEEYFEEVISDYIDNEFVKIINFRNRKVCQLQAYQDCYDNHKYEYDWIMFFDIDEFLYIKNFDNIKDYLSQEMFNDYDIIHINWMIYGDNGLITYENKPIYERFKEPIQPYNFKYLSNFPENNHIKSIIRGNLNNIFWFNNSHTPLCIKNTIKCCNNSGVECNSNSPFNDYDFSQAYLRHYQLKTIEEFIDNKLKKGFPDRTMKETKKLYNIKTFFIYNKITREKLDFIKSYYNIYT